jgi:hypothetical protein
LAKNAAPYLHLKEFTGCRGPYKGWTEEQRRRLLSDCLGCLNGLVIDMMAGVLRPADIELTPEIEELFGDPYLWVFQEALHGVALSGYMELPTERVDVIYSRQDEFRRRFEGMFRLWKATSEDGRSLGRLEFQDMRDVPGLQLADLVVYECTHYYHLRAHRPELKPRYPFLKLCEHQLQLKSGGFKYIPGWKLRLKMYGTWTVVQDILWADVDTWMPLLKQLSPPEVVNEDRIRRMALLREIGAVEQLRARQIPKER